MLNLANRLRDIDSDVAPAGLRDRSFHPDSINDDFDLAEALMRPESIAAALRVLSRQELAALRIAAEHSPTVTELTATLGDRAPIDQLLTRFLLMEHEGQLATSPEVRLELDRAGVASAAELVRADAPVALAPNPIDTSLIDRRAAERAAASVSAIAELILTLGEEPAKQLSKGGLALPDSKRIAAAAHIGLDEVEPLQRIASLAGLVYFDAHYWMPSVEANDWLDRSMAGRWAALADALWQRSPGELRAAGRLLAEEAPREVPGVHRLSELISWQFPAFAETDRVLAEFGALGERLGLVAGAELSSAGRVLAAGGGADRFEAAVESLLPGEVDRVYVQPDLSIVVPGPASAALDRGLRRFAVIEQADLAATFRLSAASLNRALSTGMHIEQIRAFLTEASLTGIPQPVEFLLADAAERFGQVRVRSCDEPPLATAVRALNPALLEQLAVDQSLSALGLVRRGNELVTRVGVTHTLLVLEAARYPAALESADGEIIPLTPGVARARDAASAIDPVQAMWTRIRSHRGDASDATAWLARQITAAVKAKTPLVVEVRLPDGGVIEYQLEPTGLAGNRMRARDRRADIERTLPLGSIVSVRSGS